MSEFGLNPEMLGARKIRLTDSFEFSCTCCGACCRGRANGLNAQSIMLTGPDIVRISNKSGLSFDELLQRYIARFHDATTGVDSCCIRMRPNGACRFLSKSRCSIYEARPSVCKLYPISRGYSFKIGKAGQPRFAQDELHYTPPDFGYKCVAEQRYTVKQWFELNSVPLVDEEEREWYSILSLASYQVQAGIITPTIAFQMLYPEYLKNTLR